MRCPSSMVRKLGVEVVKASDFVPHLAAATTTVEVHEVSCAERVVNVRVQGDGTGRAQGHHNVRTFTTHPGGGRPFAPCESVVVPMRRHTHVVLHDSTPPSSCAARRYSERVSDDNRRALSPAPICSGDIPARLGAADGVLIVAWSSHNWHCVCAARGGMARTGSVGRIAGESPRCGCQVRRSLDATLTEQPLRHIPIGEAALILLLRPTPLPDPPRRPRRIDIGVSEPSSVRRPGATRRRAPPGSRRRVVSWRRRRLGVSS